MSYGPQLPAWLAKNTDQDEDKTPLTYGPVIPKSVEKSEKDEEEEDDEPESGVYGPAIPKNVVFSNLTTERDEEEEEEEGDVSWNL